MSDDSDVIGTARRIELQGEREKTHLSSDLFDHLILILKFSTSDIIPFPASKSVSQSLGR